MADLVANEGRLLHVDCAKCEKCQGKLSKRKAPHGFAIMVDGNDICRPWNLGKTCNKCNDEIIGEDTGRQIDDGINLWHERDSSGSDTESEEPIYGRLPSKDHRQPNSDIMYTCETCAYDLCWICAARNSQNP